MSKGLEADACDFWDSFLGFAWGSEKHKNTEGVLKNPNFLSLQ